MALRVTQETFEQEVIHSEKAVLVDFYSDSCIACKRLSPTLSEVEEEYSDTIKVVKVNINFDMEIAEQYEVQTVPTLIFCKEGKEISRLSGAVRKSDIVGQIIV